MAEAVKPGSGASTLSKDTSNEERNWTNIGICLNKFLAPALVKVVGNEFSKWHQILVKPPIEIDKQTLTNHVRKLPPSDMQLNYRCINNNIVHRSPKLYDVAVKDPLSLAKLFVVHPINARFTGFDHTMELSAVLSIIAVAQPFIASGAAVLAKKVRSDVRNEWAHATFLRWTDHKFQSALDDIESLVKAVRLPTAEEKILLDNIDSFKKNGLSTESLPYTVTDAGGNVNNFIAESKTEIQWTKRSIKHGSKLSELANILKTEPSKATRIGTYRVCFEDDFCIGHGSDGTNVYVGLSDDGYEVAIKSMNLQDCQQIGDNEKKILNYSSVQKEKHIVHYRFYHPVNARRAYLVLDLHEENLRDYVLHEERTIEQLRKQGPSIIRQILLGVRALHCNNPEILHRDLKPTNILVNLEGEVLLSDFGISRTLPKERTTYKSGVSGTDGWMAAESLPNEDDDDDEIQVRYKKASDIQVVGMLCYYVLTKGRHPYGKHPVHQNPKISKGHFNLKDLSNPYAKDLITWMLQKEPSQRPNVHECLKHPYLRTAEENFNFVTRVGNEKEIKTKDPTSIVVQELNKEPVLTNWSAIIDSCVMGHMTAARRGVAYTNNAADLLRFIRNMAVHWGDKPPPANVQTTVVRPQEYFERKFPTLSVELHRIIRGHPNWKTREDLKDFF